MHEKVDFGFEISEQENGDRLSIKYAGGKMSKIFWFAIGGSALFCFVFGAIGHILVGLIFAAAIVAIGFYVQKKRSTVSQFDVTQDAISLNDGKSYATGDITEIFIKNGQQEIPVKSSPDGAIYVTNDIAQAALISLGSGTKRAVMGAKDGLKNALINEISSRSHQLVIRHGRKEIPISRHMDLETSTAMLYKVVEHLGWEIRTQ